MGRAYSKLAFGTFGAFYTPFWAAYAKYEKILSF
jgi:hypothetical protein